MVTSGNHLLYTVYIYIIFITYAFGLPPAGTYKVPGTFLIAVMTTWDIVPEEKAMFFSGSQGRKCSKMF